MPALSAKRRWDSSNPGQQKRNAEGPRRSCGPTLLKADSSIEHKKPKANMCTSTTPRLSGAAVMARSKAWERLLAARDAAEKTRLQRDGALLVAALIKQQQRGFADASRACRDVRLAQQR